MVAAFFGCIWSSSSGRTQDVHVLRELWRQASAMCWPRPLAADGNASDSGPQRSERVIDTENGAEGEASFSEKTKLFDGRVRSAVAGDCSAHSLTLPVLCRVLSKLRLVSSRHPRRFRQVANYASYIPTDGGAVTYLAASWRGRHAIVKSAGRRRPNPGKRGCRASDSECDFFLVEMTRGVAPKRGERERLTD